MFLNLLAAASDTKITLDPTGQFKGLASITVPAVIQAAITFALVIAAVVFFFMLVIGGIKWITSGGDKTQTEGARNQITAALIGLVIVFAAWAIIRLIGTFFGFNILGGLEITPIQQ